MKPRIALVLFGLLACITLLLWNQWDRTLAPALAPDAGEGPSSAIAAEPASLAPQPPTSERQPLPPRLNLTVHVVDANGDPVAGATPVVRGDDALAFAPTDADGDARSARLPKDDVTIQVAHQGASGFARWRWQHPIAREVVVRLYPDRVADVQVERADGAPAADVEVAPFRVDEQHFLSRTYAARTDARGHARVQLPGYHHLSRGEVLVCAFVADRRTASPAFAWQDGSASEVRIQLPADTPRGADATLRVRFVDANGAPVAATGTLQWHPRIYIPGGQLSGPGNRTKVDGTEARLTPSHARQGRLVLTEIGRFPIEHDVDIPKGIQQHEVTLQRGKPRPKVVLPLVDPSGAPVTDGEFLLYASSHDYIRGQEAVRPDHNGHVEIYLDDLAATRIELARPRDEGTFHWPAPQQLRRPYFTGQPLPPARVLAIVDVPRMAHGGTVTLPPVVVQPLRALVRGRVVDAAGAPVEGALVLLGSNAVPEHEAVHSYATSTDVQGRFVVRGATLPEPCFVCARRPMRFAAPIAVQVNARDVVLRLQATGTVEVPVRASAHLGRETAPGPHRRIVPHLQLLRTIPDAEPAMQAFFRKHQAHDYELGRRRWHATQRVGPNPPLLFGDLVPGVYELRAFVGKNPVLRRQQIVVRAGERTRLDDLDGRELGNEIHSALVRVIDLDGNPLKARVHFTLPAWGKQGRSIGDTDADGEARFVVPRSAVCDVEVQAQHFAPKTIRDATFPLQVTLGGGTELRFRIGGLDAVRPQVRALTVSVTDAARFPDSPVRKLGQLESLRHPLATVAPDGTATIRHLPKGRYQLWLSAHRKVHEAGPPLRFVPIGEVRVTEDASRTVDVPFDVLAEHAERLRGPPR